MSWTTARRRRRSPTNFAINFRRSRRCLKPSIDGRDGWRAERGWALVSVLWVVFILALLAAATQALAITSWRTENHALTAAKAEMDLDAASVRAIAAIRDPSAQQRSARHPSRPSMLGFK